MNPIFDILLVSGITVVSAILSAQFHFTFITSTIIYFAIPSLYLSFKKRSIIKKTLLFSILAIPTALIYDFLAFTDKTWYISQSIFRVLGIVPVEDIIWGFLWFYYVVTFWNYFCSQGQMYYARRFYTFVFGIHVLAVLFIVSLLIFNYLPGISYFYFVAGIFLELIPLLFILITKRDISKKFLLVGLYFFFISVLIEYTGLTQNQWIFPGFHYLATVNFIGYSLPFEEIFFWWVLGAPALLSWFLILSEIKH